MIAQIEITTICNYNCFYCAGRNMAQKQMAYEAFQDIVVNLPKTVTQVNLQGEGEPMLNRHFFMMANFVKYAGFNPYTITNGTVINETNVIDLAILFNKIGISIDSMSSQESKSIGRFLNEKAINSAILLKKYFDPRNILIHTVDFGQNMKALNKWCSDNGFRHFIQPLQQKEDYVICYDNVPLYQ